MMTSVWHACSEINWFVSAARLSSVGSTLSIWPSVQPGERFAKSSCIARHAFFDTYDLKLSTGFTSSLNTAKFYYIICLWNIAALRIVLQASNCFDQSEDLRSIIAVVI